MDQQRRLDLRRFGGVGRGAVIDDAGVELVARGDRQPVDEPAAPAEADRADLAAARGFESSLEHRDRVRRRLREVELADRVARRIFIGRSAAGQRQEVGRDRAEAGEAEPPCNILDMRR